MKIIRTAILWAGVLAMALPGPAAAGGDDSAASRREALTGTFELDRSRSDDPQRIVDEALRQLPASERAASRERIASRVQAPAVLALERVGHRVSVASSRVPEMTFEADGDARHERSVSGQPITTKAALYGDRLEVSVVGTNGSDFSATFEPTDGGRALRVTRRLFDEEVREPIVMQSVYRRVSNSPDWDVYADSRDATPYGSRASADTRADARGAGRGVPAGTTLVGRLDREIDLRTARRDDRISLTVRNAPRADLDDARIEGSLVDTPSGSGSRDGLLIEFDTIHLRNGESLPFAGTITAVSTPEGDPVPYNGERVEPEQDQRQQAIERGAIGAALGALIGAAAGGSKGAVVGAVLGGGGAAATVYLPIDRLNQPTLPRGTEFTIRTENAQRE